MSERVRVVRHEGRLLAAKEPGRHGADALQAEAEMLQRVQVPGVVELVGVSAGDEPVLLTRWVGPRSLADVSVPMAPERAAAICLAVAATVGRLHRAGIVHGRIDPTHVLLDADGRSVLCGFGGAGPIGAPERRPATDRAQDGSPEDGTSRRPTTDTAGLGLILGHMIGAPGAPERGAHLSRSARALASRRRALRGLAAQATVADPAGRPSVTAFAHSVRRAVPDARLSDDGPTRDPAAPRPTSVRVGAGRPPRGRHARGADRPTPKSLRSAVPAAVALLAIGATTYFGLSAWWSPSEGRTAVATPTAPRLTAPSTPTPTPTTTELERAPVIEHDGRRYEVGTPGDIVLVGPWLCDGSDLPVVLHPADGTVHLFTGWASEGSSLTAHTVATVPGAGGLSPSMTGPGCADLLVTDIDTDTDTGQVLATLTTEDLR
jgi:hypothetical protein